MTLASSLDVGCELGKALVVHCLPRSNTAFTVHYINTPDPVSERTHTSNNIKLDHQRKDQQQLPSTNHPHTTQPM